MFLLEQLAESQLKAAVENGDFDNLPGAGKPLILDDDSHIPADLRAGYRLLKNAGYLPAEVQLIKEIKKVETLLHQIQCDTEMKSLVVKLALLKSKLSGR